MVYGKEPAPSLREARDSNLCSKLESFDPYLYRSLPSLPTVPESSILTNYFLVYQTSFQFKPVLLGLKLIIVATAYYFFLQ